METPAQEREMHKLMAEISELLVTYHGGSLSDEALEYGITSLNTAYKVAKTAHAAQFRKSGEPYLFHPLRVAHLAARYWMEFSSIIACLLHDVVEDTPVSIDEVEKLFGTEVALLVSGLTKVEDAELSRDLLKEETYRNQILVAIKDIRVLCLKFWDRLDNLRTISALAPAKQVLISKETRTVYIPLARHLGMGQVADELEALSLAVIYPRRASRYQRVLTGVQQNSLSYLKSIHSNIATEFKRLHLNVLLNDTWRPFSIESSLRISRGVSALYTLDVLVDSTMDAYMALGILHRLFQPITGKLKDHLNSPSQYGYQAIKTTIQAGEYRLRVRITTRKLDRFNQAGVLAPGFAFRKQNFDDLMRSLLDGESVFDIEHLRLASATILVYTPNGEVRMLPEGSCALDFAFDIHEQLGLHAFRARINGQTRLLKTSLMDGDQVRIETTEKLSVLPKWLEWAITPKARNSIRRCLRSHVRGTGNKKA